METTEKKLVKEKFLKYVGAKPNNIYRFVDRLGIKYCCDILKVSKKILETIYPDDCLIIHYDGDTEYFSKKENTYFLHGVTLHGNVGTKSRPKNMKYSNNNHFVVLKEPDNP